jgi:histidinol-phosphate aminotransferase
MGGMNAIAPCSPLVRRSVAALAPYVPGQQLENVIKLNTNENPYPPSPAVGEALRGCDPAALRLYPNANCDGLRARLGEIFGCGPECAFAGNGSDEILRLAMSCFTTEERPAAAAFHPTYSLYPVLAAAAGVPYREVELAEDFGWAEPEGVDGAGLFLLANPNAPTGVLQPVERIRAFAARFGGVVLVDEAYVDFAGEGASAAGLALESENVLVCRTFSKSGALAGMRVGYVLGNPGLIGAFQRLKDSYNVDRLAQATALAVLSDLPYLRETAARVAATRDRVAAELRRRGWRLTDSRANFLWAKPPEGQSAGDIQRQLLEKGILVRHFPADPRTRDWLRISVGTEEQMDAVLAAL